jgi:response regulator RpfG family c-di-GMP phosphodiesterase
MSSTSVETGSVPLAAPGSDGAALPTLAELPAFRRPDTGVYATGRLRANGSPPTAASLPVPEFLTRLVESRLVSTTQLEAFLDRHESFPDNATPGLAQTLIDQGLLTTYQVGRLLTGHTFGLVLGNYRIVERIGAGGMGAVYKAEHIHMKRAVAIKVLISEEDSSSVFLQRFYSEMQATAVLSHPNIVLAFDAGEMAVPNSPHEVLRYLVMEFVPGKDLEQHVLANGPLPVSQACEAIRQAASGLQHAHEHGLVHRDIKPSNLLLTPQNQVKILDFGLARLCRRRHTEVHTMLGSVDYMAPEQARDARSVDIRADIYGLGGTLYWMLTGRKPFPGDRPVIEELLARQRESPAPLHKIRPDIPLELEAIVYQMMALDPNDRYATPLAIMTALGAFVDPASGVVKKLSHSLPLNGSASKAPAPVESMPLAQPAATNAHRVLLVSHQANFRASCRNLLEANCLEQVDASRTQGVDELLRKDAADLLLIDSRLPENSGLELCSRLRAEPPTPHLRIILLTPENSLEWLVMAQRIGADDCIPQTVHPLEFVSRIRAVLRIKDAEARADRVASHLLSVDQQLEQVLRLRDADLYQTQDVLIFAMAKMAELRGLETGAHLLRMQGYVRCLAEEAMRLPAYASRIDDAFVRMLERCVLLHDIGKVAIPDHILLKPGKLDPEERSVMESHTTVGADILAAVARQHGAPLAFLQMATEIARYHHERFDGTGYPTGLVGEAIPLAARIVTIADVYDALRSKLVYKPGLLHGASKRLILESNSGQFDPALLVAFRHCDANLEQIFAQTKD